MARQNLKVTITAGTPINLGKLVNPNGENVFADRLFIQMAKAGTGLGEVIDMDAFPIGTAPAAHGATAGQLTAQLAPATATAPGGSYSDTMSPKDGTGINLATMWLDGSVNGDVVNVSFNRRV